MLEGQLNEVRDWVILLASLSIAILLMLLPMPQLISPLRPAWVLLVLIFWALVLPGRVSLTLAWVVGLLCDVLNGTLLGEHALALTAVIYVIARLGHQLRMFSLLQQGMAVSVLVIFYQFILYCIQGFLGQLPEGLLYWFSAFTSLLVWPWLFVILRDQCQRLEN